MVPHIIALAWLITIHLIADFVLQSREMGKRKGIELKYLLAHIGIILVCFLVGACWLPAWFSVLNALIHGLIDSTIWRAYKLGVAWRVKKDMSHKLLTKNPTNPWRYWEDQKFYLTIGTDQWLHVLTILALYGMFA